VLDKEVGYAEKSIKIIFKIIQNSASGCREENKYYKIKKEEKGIFKSFKS
jgi:hypothetical protein